jgi:ADP-heptose:LPS heptosyltransferase
LLDSTRIFQALPYLLGTRSKVKTADVSNKTLAIIKVDEIGDYILFRNFLEQIRFSIKFRDFNITLIGNYAWKEIAEYFDAKYIDKFIWLDKNKFIKSKQYRNEKLKFIKSIEFEYILNPVSSRNFLFDDLIIRNSTAGEKIGYLSDSSNSPVLLNKFSNKFYTTLINLPKHINFEFFRNKYFFEIVAGQKILIDKPYFNLKKVSYLRDVTKQYIVLFPGASRKYKRWPVDKFIELIKYILKNYDYNIIISGGKAELKISNQIVDKIGDSRLINKVGNTSLVDLVYLIYSSALVISNDTAGAHISSVLGTSTIILCDGSRFGRFSPYPNNLFQNVHSIFPSFIRDIKINYEQFVKKFKYRSYLKVENIHVNDINFLVNSILKDN